MCKWCENYRFTINATSKKNLIDHGDFYLPTNYCPVCGKLLNENLKKDNDSNKRYIIHVKPNTRHNLPKDGQNYYCSAFGLHYDECTFGKKEEAHPFKTYFEAKCTADWFFNENDYEIEEIEDLTPPTKKDKKEFKENKESKEESINVSPFKEEEFWWTSDSGLKMNSFLSNNGKLYKFPAKTIEHLNQLVEAINTIVHH
uniref:Nin one binding (NOB1) Zn-ribbon like n=1 Tax=Siphoviridae sp. ctLqe90 TaxID=2825456 RepID=A0A8S5Q4C2_9CAUD|nr:MAG TPA: Nin one binding (NOB1) Zn-ribbon like [Siphoviridae sp. ctLqe90]